jgi:glutathione S-transferase/putative glutathione S-transferase
MKLHTAGRIEPHVIAWSSTGARADAPETVADYEEFRHTLIATLDDLDARLADRRFLFGDDFTESDVRLWVTLARFDLGYNPLGKISERPLTAFPNLWAYARDLYQHDAFRTTTDFGSFQFKGASFLNDGPARIEVEPREADWDAPHGREKLGG